MELMCNELSFDWPATSIAEGRRLMAQFVNVARALSRFGCERAVRISESIYSKQIGPGYALVKWLNDRDVEGDIRVYFKTVASKAPFLEDLLREHDEQSEQECVCEHAGMEALGLGAAFLLDTVAVSFAGAECFSTDPVHVNVTVAVGDDIEEFTVDVCCISDERQISDRTSWIRERLERERRVRNGRELVERWISLYSSLDLCEVAAAFLSSLNGREQYFRQLLRHFEILNGAARDWEDGPFRLSGVRWSYESSQTMANEELAQQRLFRCPDGQVRSMPAHTKLLGANIRVHFLPDDVARRVFVGYAGDHLPTSEYRT